MSNPAPSQQLQQQEEEEEFNVGPLLVGKLQVSPSDMPCPPAHRW